LPEPVTEARVGTMVLTLKTPTNDHPTETPLKSEKEKNVDKA